jgi:hypothetical protein
MQRRLALMAVLVAATWSSTRPASAQEIEPAERTTPGWVFTPTAVFGVTFDDNPVLAGTGDPTPGDTLTHVRPGFDLSYNGRYTRLSGTYRGGLLRYRTFSEYDSYDQGGEFQVRHRASRRVSLFGRNSFRVSPATDIVEVSGVPFYRAGTRQAVFDAGTTVALSRTLEATGSYQYQTVDFDAADPEIALLLLGGSAHGANLDVRRQVNERIEMGVGYRYQRASYGAAEGGFGVQNAELFVTWRLQSTLDLEAGAGVSRLSIPEGVPASGDPVDALTPSGGSRTGPAGRVGLRKRTAHANFTVNVSRSFVPAFGFGGSVRNQEVSAGVAVPFARRRGYVRSELAFRDSEPVLAEELAVSSTWLQTTVGYALLRWARFEVFYNGAFQDTVAVAGGRVNRNRFGIQLSTSQPLRIQ